MAVLTRDEYFARLQGRLAEDTSDDGIAFLEDMTDTYNDLESRANGDGVDWERKYRELDESWKKRYRHRFFSGGDTGTPNSGTIVDETKEYDPDEVKVEDLFSEKEEK